MLDSDLFEVLAPVLGETHLFLALFIKLAHDVVKALLEPLLENCVVVVPRTDYSFMMQCVLHFNLTCDLILDTLRALSSA